MSVYSIFNEIQSFAANILILKLHTIIYFNKNPLSNYYYYYCRCYNNIVAAKFSKALRSASASQQDLCVWNTQRHNGPSEVPKRKKPHS